MFQESYPKLSAEVAGDRKFDIYMGIDVFGRGSFGGGQWTVCLGHSLIFSSLCRIQNNDLYLIISFGPVLLHAR